MKLLLAIIIFSLLSYFILPAISKKFNFKDSEKMKNILPVTANAKAGLFILAILLGIMFIPHLIIFLFK